MPKSKALLAEMQKDVWTMEPKHLEAFLLGIQERSEVEGLTLAVADSAADGPEAAVGEGAGSRAALRIENGTAIIPLIGTLMKEVPRWFKINEIAATAYGDIRDQLAEAVENSAVEAILLHIYSPGGQVSGQMEAAEAIVAAGKIKPLTAYIEDIGTSGAYWLASQASHITANPNAMVGAIGVFTVYADFSKMAENEGVKVHVIRSGEHKGMHVPGAAITESQIANVQEYIDGIAGNFIAAVAAGRGMKTAQVKPLATGQVWLAAAAKEVGLIDEVAILDPTAPRANTNNHSSKGAKVMAENENQEAIEKAKADATAAADKKHTERMSALQAAFPDDPAFAMEQFTAGADVTAAKAAYADVLTAKLATAEAEKVQLQAAVDAGKGKGGGGKAPGGADPLTNSEEGGGDEGDQDFMAVAKDRAKTDKISMKEAMTAVAKENPDLHKAFRAKCPTHDLRAGAERISR